MCPALVLMARKAAPSTPATPGRWASAAWSAGESLASIHDPLFDGTLDTQRRPPAARSVNWCDPELMAGSRLPSTQANPTAAPTAVATTDVRFGSLSRLATATRAGPRWKTGRRPQTRIRPG